MFLESRRRNRFRTMFLCVALALSLTLPSCRMLSAQELSAQYGGSSVDSNASFRQIDPANNDDQSALSDMQTKTVREVGSSQDLFFVLQDSLYTFQKEAYVSIESMDLFRQYWNDLTDNGAVHSAFLAGPIELLYLDTSPCTVKMSFVYDEAGEILSKYYSGEKKEFSTLSAADLYHEALRVNQSLIKPDMSSLEKETAIHDYLVSNSKYSTEGDPLVLSKAQSVLFDGQGQCQGYAEAFTLLLTMAGVEARVISGYTTNSEGKKELHAWNQVRIDNFWYHVDVTWDDPVPDTQSYVTHQYFNRSDAVFKEDHSWSTDYFMCPYDDHSVNDET